MNKKEVLLERCGSKCELCSSDSLLNVYDVPPVTVASLEKAIMICSTCLEQIENPESINVNHWYCLNESMWSEIPAVQVMAWRLLKRLSNEGWAQDLLNQLYLDETLQQWAESDSETTRDKDKSIAPTKDSNGNILADGDTVTLIKDLDVKGANFTAKRGTSVKNISLTSNPEQIEGRVNGTQIVLLTRFLKKT
jgi:protein PhnA